MSRFFLLYEILKNLLNLPKKISREYIIANESKRLFRGHLILRIGGPFAKFV